MAGRPNPEYGIPDRSGSGDAAILPILFLLERSAMYSHGSSARAGIGKRGHGGREYRPPRERRDAEATPPPLKEGACLLRFFLDEYSRPAPRRDHRCFGGRDGLRSLERALRSRCLCHLVVPGRRQSGPVAIVGRTIREALSGAAKIGTPSKRSLFGSALALSPQRFPGSTPTLMATLCRGELSPRWLGW